MRTVELIIPEWTAAIPANWKFEVQFSNDASSGFWSFAGQKLKALRGSMLRGEGPIVEALFNSMLRSGFAKDMTPHGVVVTRALEAKPEEPEQKPTLRRSFLKKVGN